MIMERLTSKRAWENASQDLASEMGYSHIWKRLAAIEDILGDEYDLSRLRALVEADRDRLRMVLPCKLGSVVQFCGNPDAEKQTVDCISFYADGKITFGFQEYGMKTTWVDEWGEDDAENYNEVKETTTNAQ